KLRDGQTKWMLRRITDGLLPEGVVEAPKRPLQTPQREWLRGPLKDWACDRIEEALESYAGTWLDARAVRAGRQTYLEEDPDNSSLVWGGISPPLGGEGGAPPGHAGAHPGEAAAGGAGAAHEIRARLSGGGPPSPAAPEDGPPAPGRDRGALRDS